MQMKEEQVNMPIAQYLMEQVTGEKMAKRILGGGRELLLAHLFRLCGSLKTLMPPVGSLSREQFLSQSDPGWHGIGRLRRWGGLDSGWMNLA